MVDTKNLYDVVIIGGGPAGLTAAIYLTRAKYRVLVLEKEQFGGQIVITHEVVNYPGVGTCSGKALTDTMYQQAEYFGAEFLIAEATGLEMDDVIKVVHTNRGDYKCLGVLLATGAHPRMVGFKGEEEFKGRGVAYCATCDGEFFTGKQVFVVGGGYAAAEESVFLTKFASHVTVLIRGEDFSCAEAVAEKARRHEKIDVLTNRVVEEVSGERGLNYIRYKNKVTGEITEYRAKEGENFGVFVFAGYAPETNLVKGIAKLNEQGYVITDKAQGTSVEGLYAAGDICIKSLRQVVTATSDGALAATELEKHVAKVQEQTGIRTEDPVIREKATSEKKEGLKSEQKRDTDEHSDGMFDAQTSAQLKNVFSKMENKLVLKLFLDEGEVSSELRTFIETLVAMTDKLTMQVVKDQKEPYAPCVRLYGEGDVYTGLGFHGVPGGHEFTSFVLGLYNAAGPGQPLDEEVKERIKKLKQPLDIKILVTLSCSMCPDLVIAAQHLAAINDKITTEIYDVMHFDSLAKEYNVMSVPCMVINDVHVSFGKKNMQQLLDYITNLHLF